MRDLDALLTSFVAIGRAQLIAVLTSERKTAEQLLVETPRRTQQQRARRREIAERITRLSAMLSYFRHGPAARGLSGADQARCEAVERKFRREP